MEDDNAKSQVVATDDDSDEISSDSKMEAEDKEYQETIKEIEKARKEREEKKKAAMERLKKEREGYTKSTDENESGEQGANAGKKKVYSREIKVFRHNKLNDFSVSGLKKIDKTLQKVHGVDIKKKIAFMKALEVYNPTKSTLKKKDFDKFARSFKSKRFNGKNFDNVEKAGINIKDMRKKFSKRDIDKLRRGITGDQDPYRYKSKSSDDVQKGNSPAPAKNTRVH
ncbi:MAG: hypothetical protein KAI71_04650 [Candidatus Pacebacteria bacterium]|nr:hypothetical protein [Candidatus Paceibacterota bacterium]